MTPDQIDELARALYACFCPFGSFKHAFPATQECYRNGVRVVLERAGAMGGDDAAKEPMRFPKVDPTLVEFDRIVEDVRRECGGFLGILDDLRARGMIDKALSAAGVERLRENLAAVLEGEAEAEKRAEAAEKERDERAYELEAMCAERDRLLRMVNEAAEGQKARADRAEHSDAEARGAIRQCLERTDCDSLTEVAQDAVRRIDRIAALEKAIREHVDSYPWQEAPELTALRAALDAPQPKDHTDSGQPAAAVTDGRPPSAEPAGCSSPIPDGVLIAAAVYECVVLNQKEGGLKTALNASGQYAGLDYGLDLEARLRARKEARGR